MTNTSAPEQEPLPDEIEYRNSQQTELPSRYWTFLFDNLKRSIEQIYQTCESDQNSDQCQEVVQFLSRYCQEFEILSKSCQHLENLANRIDKTRSLFRNYLSTSLISLPYQTESSFVRPFEHSQSICNGELFRSGSLSGRQKRLHNSDINLTVNNNSYSIDTNKFKRQKSNKYRRTTENLSIISLPSLFSSAKSAHDSAMTLVPTTNFKQTIADETAADADDEKDARDESVHTNRHHRYHHHLSSTSLYRFQQQNMTSEDDDDEELLLINHHGMMDFMDRQIFDAFDREESLTAALEAEQERTIASLMAEEEALKHQLNNVTDDGSELEETELSTRKALIEKDMSPIDQLRDENDSESDSKSRRKHLRIHEKLSSPSRVRPLSETLREAAERQERAFTRRQVLRDERARKMRELTHRVNEVRQWKEELIKARKTTIEMKMHRAEEKRLYLLLLRAKKAGDEDLKGQEIAFIKSLQQEHRRQTLKERYQKEEQLKQYLEEERVRKHDEHKQRELAAENRRKQLEATRQRRLNEMQEKWKIRERMIEQQLIERRKQKQTAAVAKQKNFQQKRAEHVADLKTSTAELKKKLAVKQEETTRRHATQLEEVRRKAVEMSVHRGPSAEDHHSSSQVDEKKTTESIDTHRKFCTLCNLLLASDIHLQTHLRGTRHNQLLIEKFNQKNDNGIKKQPKQDEIDSFNSECITSVTNDDIVRQEMSFNRERKHAMKKRAKKLRLRMTQRSTAYEAENAQRPYLTSTHKARIQRFLNELEKSLSTTARKEPLNTTNFLACQRILSELVKIFDIHGYEKDSQLEQRVFYSLNGYSTLTKMIELRAECNKPPLAPENLIALTVSVYRAATTNNSDNALYLLNSGKIITIVESLDRHLNSFKLDDQISSVDQSENERLNQIDLIANLSEFLANLLIIYNSKINEIHKRNEETNEEKLFISRLTDLISYTANIGILDRIGIFFRTPRALFINSTKSRLSDMIIHLLNILQQMIQFSKSKITHSPFNSPSKKSTTDSAQVLSIMKFSNFCEVLSLLYGILAHETDTNTHPMMTDNNSNLLVNDKIYLIVINSLNLLNTIAILDLETFQITIGEESISLQLRHVTNYILTYCNHQQNQTGDNLLREILILLGYYSVLNPDNQCRLACGNRPTVLQQISCLPFRYFVESKYMEIIFPTLISCSFECETARAILQTEMSLDLIVNYIQAKTNEDDLQSAFSMRFPREQWSKALKYYRNESEEKILEKKYTDEEKENVSQ